MISAALPIDAAPEEKDIAGRRVSRLLLRQLGEKIAPADLATQLKDGILLCQLMNSLRPNCIPKISHRPLSFLQMENICNFLKACSKEFHVRDSDMFAILDLYEARDIRRVIRTILLLEKAFIRELKASGQPVPLPVSVPPSPDRTIDQTQFSDVGPEHQTEDQAVKEFFERQLGVQINELQAELQDGVLLCRLMNSLLPNSIPVVHEKKSPFFRMENVNNFLKAARNYGIAAKDLFEAQDLIQAKNVRMVLLTVLALAHQSGHPTGSVNSLRRTMPSVLLTTQSSKLSSLPRRSVGDHDLARVIEHLSKRSTSSLVSNSPHKPAKSRMQQLPPVEEDLRGRKLSIGVDGECTQVYQIGNCIGRGHFGTVYKGLNLSNGEMVAIKRIRIDESNFKETRNIMNEVDLLKSLNHTNIVRYEGFLQQDGCLNIILEFVENGSLYHTLKQFGAFPETLVLYYVIGMLQGLIYLHGRNVIHRDLKAANILTTKDGTIKLSDFGVSKEIDFDENDTTVAGTPNWMPPEIIERRGASTGSDIWSLGCTILELITGRPPFADCNPMTVLFRIVEDEHPPFPESLSEDLRAFLLCCFQRNPDERNTAAELLQHPWIVKNHNSKHPMMAFLPDPSAQDAASVPVDEHGNGEGSASPEKKTVTAKKKAKYLRRRSSKDKEGKCCMM